MSGSLKWFFAFRFSDYYFVHIYDLTHVCHMFRPSLPPWSGRSKTNRQVKTHEVEILTKTSFGARSTRSLLTKTKTKTKLHGLSPQANYTDRLSDRRLSAKLVPTSADRGCSVISATIPPQSLIFGFLDRSRYFVEIAPQLSSRGWVDPVPDPLPLRKNLVAPGIELEPLNL
jgi:hypothetical protein